MLVLGGSLHHTGGLEAFCARAVAAIGQHAGGWQAQWWPTDSAYLTLRRIASVGRAWRRLAHADGFDLVWLQWSTLADLMFLWRAKRRGLAVMVTPHLGANSRLQRSPVLRRLCLRLLARSDRLALLFAEQAGEIALPAAIPRTVVGTFLPQAALRGPIAPRSGGRLALIHAGRLSAGKGTFRVIALGAALRARGVAFDARIVGSADAATMAALGRAIADAGLEDAVRLVGWMDEPALLAALGKADLLVHLSELDSFPLIVLEAIAAGALPLVADMAGVRAMAERYGGLVFAARDIEAVADRVAGLDPAALRRTAAEAAGRVRDDLAWDRCAERVLRAADATIGAAAGRAP